MISPAEVQAAADTMCQAIRSLRTRSIQMQPTKFRLAVPLRKIWSLSDDKIGNYCRLLSNGQRSDLWIWLPDLEHGAGLVRTYEAVEVIG